MDDESTDDEPAWRTYPIDAQRRRLVKVDGTPVTDADDWSGNSSIVTTEAKAGFEIEHVPSGLRISWARQSTDPVQETIRIASVPDLLREAADWLEPPRRPGPAAGPDSGWDQLVWCVATLWLEAGTRPTQERVAEALNYSEPSALARAVRPVGWDLVCGLAVWQLRRWQGRLGELPEDPQAGAWWRERFAALDLTGF